MIQVQKARSYRNKTWKSCPEQFFLDNEAPSLYLHNLSVFPLQKNVAKVALAHPTPLTVAIPTVQITHAHLNPLGDSILEINRNLGVDEYFFDGDINLSE